MDIDQHVDDPERTEGRKNVCADFGFEPCPPRVAGSDNDGLKNTQERCGAEGKTPGDSVQVHHYLATNVI